jgi:dsDNA-specific endonuclease/ATPase MutS2
MNEQMIELLKKVQQEMPSYMEMIEKQSELVMYKFKCLKKEGFTDEQALELCKHKILQW